MTNNNPEEAHLEGSFTEIPEIKSNAATLQWILWVAVIASTAAVRTYYFVLLPLLTLECRTDRRLVERSPESVLRRAKKVGLFSIHTPAQYSKPLFD
jgi:hypothetical protein